MLALIGGVLGLITAVLELIRAKGKATRRDNLMYDLSIFRELEESETKTRFQSHIEREVGNLMSDQAKRRDWFGVGLGAGFMLAAAGLAIFPFMRESNWWLFLLVPAVALGIFGFAGFMQDVMPMERSTPKSDESAQSKS